MDIIVNDKPISVTDNIKIPQLLEQIQSPLKGVAVAVDDTVIPRAEWETYSFSPHAQVLVIKAHSGG